MDASSDAEQKLSAFISQLLSGVVSFSPYLILWLQPIPMMLYDIYAIRIRVAYYVLLNKLMIKQLKETVVMIWGKYLDAQ